MTVACTHPIHAPGLVETVQNLDCAADVHLYFPVPLAADRFYGFSVQPFFWPNAPKNESATAKLSREAAKEKGDVVLGRV